MFWNVSQVDNRILKKKKIAPKSFADRNSVKRTVCHSIVAYPHN